MSQARKTIAANTAQGKTAPARQLPARAPITLETVRLLAPHSGTAEAVARTFGKDVPEFETIADLTTAHLTAQAESLAALSEKALEIHLQRIVGAYVGSAYGAAKFYSDKVSEARRMTSAGSNDDRDEDRGGPAGFDDRAARARLFAADLCMQAYALLAQAEGAVTAYHAITGSEWKPYVAQNPDAPSLQRRAGTEEMGAFG